MKARGLIAALLWAAFAAPAAGVPAPPKAQKKRTMAHTNALAREKSPYLLQHALNPVDWRPWGPEAFAAAVKEDKPILLSIGYSTCHWCHVMERESFENPGIAALMNRSFVCIKVDREERPDVDRIYMSAVTAMTGRGGWPLTVFLTPERKPFYGGTYFPPEPRWGQPGFPQLLERVAQLWKERRSDLIGDSAQLTKALQGRSAAPGPESKGETPDPAWLERAFRSFEGSFDPEEKGFGGAPKFPMPVNLSFLLRRWAAAGEKKALDMTVSTLRAMAGGGIFDQLGGGFHRYSTDERWRIPHFEKMLYDNAQLASAAVEAFQASGDPALADAARRTLDYLLRDMTHQEGGFYSAEDADSAPSAAADAPSAPKAEGAFYLWSDAELDSVLKADAPLFSFHYGILPEGNALSDPHDEFVRKNVLYLARTTKETAEKFKLTTEQTQKILGRARARLMEVRASRPRPGLDDKILTSWNGLAISAFAKAFQAFEDPRDLEAAERAAGFIRKRLYDEKSRELHHRWRDDERAIGGMADDYAFLAAGLLDLYEASFRDEWLYWAEELHETLSARFAAPEGGVFMTAEGHDPALLLRPFEDSDNVEPCASSVAAMNGLRLAELRGRPDFRAQAEKTLARFAPAMRERPLSVPAMLAAADWTLSKPRQIVLAGDPADPAAAALLRVIRRKFLPVKVLLWARGGSSQEGLAKNLPFLKGVKPLKGKPAAYVCVDFTCKLPTSDPSVLEKILDEKESPRK